MNSLKERAAPLLFAVLTLVALVATSRVPRCPIDSQPFTVTGNCADAGRLTLSRDGVADGSRCEVAIVEGAALGLPNSGFGNERPLTDSLFRLVLSDLDGGWSCTHEKTGRAHDFIELNCARPEGVCTVRLEPQR